MTGPRLRLAVGLLTTVTFLGLGAVMLGEARTGLGAAFLALGTFRGAWLAKEHFKWEES